MKFLKSFFDGFMKITIPLQSAIIIYIMAMKMDEAWKITGMILVALMTLQCAVGEIMIRIRRAKLEELEK